MRVCLCHRQGLSYSLICWPESGSLPFPTSRSIGISKWIPGGVPLSLATSSYDSDVERPGCSIPPSVPYLLCFYTSGFSLDLLVTTTRRFSS